MSINIDRLLVQLNNTGLQNKDNPLYQFLKQELEIVKTLNTSVTKISSSSSTIINNITSSSNLVLEDTSSEDFLLGVASSPGTVINNITNQLLSFEDGFVEDSVISTASLANPASGTGTTNKITKWLNGPLGTLTDSIIQESSGQIGIGGSPSDVLDVKGLTRITGLAGQSNYLRLDNTANASGRTWRIGDTGAGAAGTFQIYDQTDSKTVIHIDGTQQVGINTTSPNMAGSGGYALTLDGGTAKQGYLEVGTEQADAAGLVIGDIAATWTHASSDARLVLLRTTSQGATANNRGGQLDLYIKQNGAGLIDVMTWFNDGGVSIGTTDPGLGSLSVSNSIIISGTGNCLEIKSGASTLTMDTGLFGVSTRGQQVLIGANTSGSGAPGALNIVDRTNTNRFIFFDSIGVIRTNTTQPVENGGACDLVGTIIGFQTEKNNVTLTYDGATKNNNINPSTGNVVRFSNNGTNTSFGILTGLTGGVAGRIILIFNDDTQALHINLEDASSTAANRFYDPTGVLGPPSILAGFSRFAYYSGDANRWSLVTANA